MNQMIYDRNHFIKSSRFIQYLVNGAHTAMAYYWRCEVANSDEFAQSRTEIVCVCVCVNVVVVFVHIGMVWAIYFVEKYQLIIIGIQLFENEY